MGTGKSAKKSNRPAAAVGKKAPKTVNAPARAVTGHKSGKGKGRAVVASSDDDDDADDDEMQELASGSEDDDEESDEEEAAYEDGAMQPVMGAK